MKKLALALSFLLSTPAMAIDVEHTSTPITIDGVSESAWDKATWHDMPYLMDGTLPSNDADFKGRYRLLWDQNYLYLQADIVDDVLIDTHADPTYKYWDDDAIREYLLIAMHRAVIINLITPLWRTILALITKLPITDLINKPICTPTT